MDKAFVMDSPVDLVACLDGHGVGDGLKQITLIPSGYVQSKAGNMLMDERAYRDVLANFNAHRTEVPIDYEHQTLGGEYASPSGLAPASGWIRQIYFDKTKGLMGLVEWTERAKEMIRAGEYRYLSPTVAVRKSDKRPVELHSAALTNKPAIVGMERLAAKEHFQEAESMADEPETIKTRRTYRTSY